MSWRWRRSIRRIVLAVLCLTPGAASRRAIASPRGAAPAAAAVRDVATGFDANEIGVQVSNLGWVVPQNATATLPGLEWPSRSGRRAVFMGGLWIGARVVTDTLVTVAEYSSEWAAGPINQSGAPMDPTESDPYFHVYSIRRCDTAASNPDYANWPWAFGAPRGPGGAPLLRGDQTLWSVYNDAVTARHDNGIGSTAPLGVEVRQTTYGFHRGGDLERAVFYEFDIHNRGSHLLEDAYAALWFDPDLGGPSDDLVGCDTSLDLGYVYNGSNDDEVYGAHAPAFGCALLQGPIVAGDTLGMTSFGRLLKDWNEPLRRGTAYRRMVRGLPDANQPPPYPCDSPGTRFEVSGDPVTATGCRDTLPADRRFMMSTGPFTLAPGDSQRIVAVLAIGGRDGQGDRRSNLTLLRDTVREARAAYASDFAAYAALACDTPLSFLAATPNPGRDAQRFTIVVGGSVSEVRVRVHDLAGRQVWSRSYTGLHPGVQTIEWDGRDDDGESLPAGVYLVQADDGRRRSSGRLVRLR